MPRCAKCGVEHELLDPVFNRPEAFIALSPEERKSRARSTDDVCVIRLREASERFFVRTVLPVRVTSYPDGLGWGVWVELGGPDFARIHELWDDEEQASEPPFAGHLANRIPSYPDTVGLPVSVQLTGPTSRPEASFRGEVEHPFAAECRAGVTLHRAAEWNALMMPN